MKTKFLTITFLIAFTSVFGQQASIYNSIKLSLNNGNLVDENVIYFNDFGDNNFNPSGNFVTNFGDAPKSISTSQPSIYTIVNGVNIAINEMGGLDTDKVVMLGITIIAGGNYTISGIQFQYIRACSQIYLIDNVTNAAIDLRTFPFYTVSLAAGSYNNRFSLKFYAPCNMLSTASTCYESSGTATTHLPSIKNVDFSVKDLSQIVIDTASNFNGLHIEDSLNAGSYIYTFYLDNGIVDVDTAVISTGTFNVNILTTDSFFLPGDTVNFTTDATANTNVSWSFGDNTDNEGGTNINHVYDSVGTYLVTIYSALNGCVDVTYKTIYITTTVNNSSIYSSKNLFNYNANTFYFIDKNILKEFIIYDVSGNIVYSNKNTSSNIDVNNFTLKSGMYVAIAKAENVIQTQKIIIVTK